MSFIFLVLIYHHSIQLQVTLILNPTRTRKLLLHRLEIDRLREKITQKGFTVVPLKLYWARGKVKIEIGLAKGKKAHDKRQTIKDRDWKRDKDRVKKDINR